MPLPEFHINFAATEYLRMPEGLEINTTKLSSGQILAILDSLRVKEIEVVDHYSNMITKHSLKSFQENYLFLNVDDVLREFIDGTV
jgi:hypothetical protein